MGTYHLYTGDDGGDPRRAAGLEQAPRVHAVPEGGWLLAGDEGAGASRALQGGARQALDDDPFGKFEVGLGDGSKHQFGPGDIRFIEDTTGHGHTSQFLEPTVFSVVEVQEGYGPGDR